jgi:sulfite exporter TauE/SafE
MTAVEFGVVFVLGLVGSLHCLQMCGPIVLAYSLPLDRARALRSHLQYNAGRVLTYAALGALAGVAGHGIGLLGRMAGLASGARVVAGAAMIVAGVAMVGIGPAKGGLVKIQKSAGRRLMAPGGKFQLGLILGFLPCGLIYAALMKAVETGSAAGGAATMLSFGLGTSAALLALGFTSSLAGFRVGPWSTRVAAVCVMASGVVLIWRGLMVPVCHG